MADSVGQNFHFNATLKCCIKECECFRMCPALCYRSFLLNNILGGRKMEEPGEGINYLLSGCFCFFASATPAFCSVVAL